MYHSHHDEIRDVASGLIGPLIVTRKGMARPDSSPVDVDREIVAGFIEVDETPVGKSRKTSPHIRPTPRVSESGGTRSETSWCCRRSAGTPGYGRRERVQSATLGPNFKETINGFSYGHTPGITMRVGQRVRWYAMGSTNFEFHTPHWHGNVVTANHMRTDVGAARCRWVCSSPTWCRTTRGSGSSTVVSSHLRMGMRAFYTVETERPATSN